MAWGVWKKAKDGFEGRAGDFIAVVTPKGDGRWSWEVKKTGADSPMATGLAKTSAAAKRTVENFLERGAH